MWEFKFYPQLSIHQPHHALRLKTDLYRVFQAFVSSALSQHWPGHVSCILLLALQNSGMSYQAYLNLGGAERGQPGYQPETVFDPDLHKTIPYLLMTAVLGVFMLTQLRKLMIIDWRLPFPSGTASGIMMTSFHTAVSRAAAGCAWTRKQFNSTKCIYVPFLSRVFCMYIFLFFSSSILYVLFKKSHKKQSHIG